MRIEPYLKKITDKEPFFSTLVYRLNPVETESVPTTATDGENLMYNSEFLKDLSDDERCGVLLHEVLHCVFMHLWRRGKRDQMRWNMACDFAINTIVNHDWPLPKGSLLDMQYADMSAEEIYDKIKLYKIKVKKQGWCDKEGWEDGQSSPSKSKGKGDQSGKEKEGEGQGMLDKLKKALGGGKVHDNIPKKPLPTPSLTKEQREQIWNQEQQQKVQDWGDMPASMQRIFEQSIYIPVVDWQALMAQILTEDVNDYSFSQPDRRYLEEPFILPDVYSIDRVKDVVFAFDTSGSIGHDDLRAFHGETQNVMKQFPNLAGWAAVCDAALYSFKEITANDGFDQYGFYGGGGTDFRPVFQEVEKLNLRPKAMFFFTDTYGYFPDKDPGYPVYWMVRSYIGDGDRYEVPFGEVIKFLR